jgi:uncharacterized RDD family membrane protein YckC
VVGLKVVRTDGKKMSYDHAAVRNFGKLLPLLPFDLLFGWRIKNQAFMRYFDKFAGTTVIDLRFNFLHFLCKVLFPRFTYLLLDCYE